MMFCLVIRHDGVEYTVKPDDYDTRDSYVEVVMNSLDHKFVWFELETGETLILGKKAIQKAHFLVRDTEEANA